MQCRVALVLVVQCALVSPPPSKKNSSSPKSCDFPPMAHSLENESFAICVQACDVEVLEADLTHPEKSPQAGNLIFLQPGALVKVKEVYSSNETTTIRIYDFYTKNLAFENNLFVCPSLNLHRVAPPLWPFLIGIREPPARIAFFRQHEAVALALSLKGGDQVKAVVEGTTLNCIVRHIGLVSEIGPGFYFGLEITVGWHYLLRLSLRSALPLSHLFYLLYLSRTLTRNHCSWTIVTL